MGLTRKDVADRSEPCACPCGWAGKRVGPTRLRIWCAAWDWCLGRVSSTLTWSMGSMAYDFAGKIFGHWRVLERTSGKTGYWRCVCSCGTERNVPTEGLRTGRTQSCGCQRPQNKPENLAGKKIGKWTVLSVDEESRGSCQLKWKCRCDCGTERSVFASMLRTGGSKSCGCSDIYNDDMIGERFGLLTVTEVVETRVGKRQSRQKAFNLLCDCGQTTVRTLPQLEGAEIPSCGCVKGKVRRVNLSDKE